MAGRLAINPNTVLKAYRELEHEGLVAARPGVGAAEGAVIAVGLLTLLETAAASWLTDDESVAGLGRAGFLDETALLAERVAGP